MAHAGMAPDLDRYVALQQEHIHRELERLLPSEQTPPEIIHRAMRYSLFAGGKRIRPLLAHGRCRSRRRCADGIEAAACSLELIHTYSLIHDDLPALDNDDLPPRPPTCHKVFGEAMAILAGDALLTLAFRVLARLTATPPPRHAMIAELATAAGTVGGMIGGQVHDLEGEGQTPTAEIARTAFTAPKPAPCCAPASGSARIYARRIADLHYEALSCYGEHIGLAFQIVDDILDVEQSSEALGKTAGKDAEQHKITFPGGLRNRRVARMAEEQLALRPFRGLAPFGDRARAFASSPT